MTKKIKYAQKWNHETHRYEAEPYELPERATSYEIDMDKIIQCANCGKDIPFGDCFTSQRIHTKSGFGYSECSDCYFGYRETVKEHEKNQRK